MLGMRTPGVISCQCPPVIRYLPVVAAAPRPGLKSRPHEPQLPQPGRPLATAALQMGTGTEPGWKPPGRCTVWPRRLASLYKSAATVTESRARGAARWKCARISRR